ncbi:T cell receptor alpha chain constant [Manis javanica]|nr:T cell receptor alpha chain constant [Manis javanica]
MWTRGSKRTRTLAWSSNTEFRCKRTFNQTFCSSSEIPCNAKLVEKSLETDMNLNFQNLSVIGLCILLLKVASSPCS